MRTLGVLAATLACASAGLLALALPDGGQAAPKIETQKKTIVIERDGDDDQGPGGRDSVMTFALPGMGNGVRIGVTVANLDEEQAKATGGVVVTSVRDESPAAKAGIKEKDIITSFDGEKVRSAAQMTRLVGETPPGRAVPVTAMREGKRVELQVTPQADGAMSMLGGEHHSTSPRMRGESPMLRRDGPMPPGGNRFYFEMPPGHESFPFHDFGQGGDGTFDTFVAPPGSRGRLGIGIEELTPQLAEFFGTKDGVLVTMVSADSPAAKAGLKAGDVITAVNDKAVTSGAELVAAVREVNDGGDVRISYTRDRKTANLVAKLDATEKTKPKRRGEPV